MQTLKTNLKKIAASLLCKTGLDELLSKRDPSKPLVLMYHRVIDPKTSPYPLQAGMYVTPETFSMQMEFLSERMNFVSIEQVEKYYSNKDPLPKDSVCITFDDGWLDNYTHAFSVLKKYRIPACIFLPTAFIETDKWFWSDRFASYAYSIKEEKSIRDTIVDISESTEIKTETLEEIQKLLHTNSTAGFHQHLDNALGYLKKIPLKKRNELLAILEKHSDGKKEERLFLNWAEAKEMESAGITFGSHSHNHLMFEYLSKEEIENEMEISQARLAMHLKNLTNVFCYPEGSCSEHSHKALAEIGVSTTVLNKKLNILNEKYNSIGRIGIHEDISFTKELFNCRLKLQSIF